jgi:hypothetical protein
MTYTLYKTVSHFSRSMAISAIGPEISQYNLMTPSDAPDFDDYCLPASLINRT